MERMFHDKKLAKVGLVVENAWKFGPGESPSMGNGLPMPSEQKNAKTGREWGKCHNSTYKQN